MSNVRVKYIGTADRFSEVSITGQQQVWQKGEAGFVSDTNAALLIASGQFALAEVQRAQLITDASGSTAGIAGADGRIYHGTKTGVSALQRIVGGDPGIGTGAGSGVGYLMDVQRTAPFPFSGVRLVFENYDVTAPMQINAAGVAVTSAVTIGSGADAGRYTGGPAGNTLTWKPVTFNGGATTGIVPQAVAGVGSTANGIHIQPGYLISDFIPILSVARADGSPLPFLRTRAHVNDNSFVLNVNQSGVNQLTTVSAAPLTGGHVLLAAQKSSATAANALTDALTPYYYGGNVEPVGVIYYGSQQMRTVCAFGDSLSQGVKSTGNYLGWPERLNAKYGSLPSGVSFSVANRGVSGQRLENSLANCRNFCAQYKPHYAAFFAWSPNNSPAGSQAAMDALWSLVLYTIDYLQQIGVTPVVLTSAPVNGNSPTDASLVKAQNARVMALPSSVVKVDIATALTDPTTINASSPTINPAYSSGDGTHYNDAGYALMADAVYAAIK